MIKFIDFNKLYGIDTNFDLFISQCDDLIHFIKINKEIKEKEIIFINDIIKDITNKYQICKNSKLKYSLMKMVNSELKLYYYTDIKDTYDMTFDFIESLINLDNKLKYLLRKEEN